MIEGIILLILFFSIPVICVLVIAGIIVLVVHANNHKIDKLDNNKIIKEMNKEISNISDMVNNRNQQKN